MSRASPSMPAASAGFTLLELLVVLVLAAMAAATVVSGGQSFLDRSRYHQAVRDVASQLRMARALCLRDGKPVAVTYDQASRTLSVEGGKAIVVAPGVQVQWKPAPVRDSAPPPTTPGQALFVFNADGGARGGAFFVGREGHGVAFRVNWLLGTIEQGPAAAAAIP